MMPPSLGSSNEDVAIAGKAPPGREIGAPALSCVDETKVGDRVSALARLHFHVVLASPRLQLAVHVAAIAPLTTATPTASGIQSRHLYFSRSTDATDTQSVL
eukprot:3863377-Rhodomonas_salina.11